MLDQRHLIRSGVTMRENHPSGLIDTLRRIKRWLRRFLNLVRTEYRPERHYMRGARPSNVPVFLAHDRGRSFMGNWGLGLVRR